MVSIPESRGLILSLTKSKAVTRPAPAPKANAKRVDIKGFVPPMTNRANTKAPRGKVPSTDRSAISSTL